MKDCGAIDRLIGTVNKESPKTRKTERNKLPGWGPGGEGWGRPRVAETQGKCLTKGERYRNKSI